MLSLIVGAVALVFSVRILRIAVKYPIVPVFLMCGVLLCVPFALLDWAEAPRFVVVSPLLVLLGFAAWKFAVAAFAQQSQLRSTRRAEPTSERGPRNAGRGWWNAPTVTGAGLDHSENDTAPAEQTAQSNIGAAPGTSSSDDATFEEMMRRNFPDGGRLSSP